MNKLKVILRLFLKWGYINHFKNFHVSQGSAVGAFSRILFASDGASTNTQSITLGRNARVGRSCELTVWDNNKILINDHATINDGCKLLGDVTIHRYTLFSSNIFASSGDHYALMKPTWLIKDQDEFVLSTEEGRAAHSAPIVIEEDCWIGFGVFIKRGTYIGRGAIVGANSVVTHDIAPYSIQVGAPAKEVRRRLEFDPPRTISPSRDEDLPYFYRGFQQRRERLSLSQHSGGIFVFSDAIAVLKKVEEIKGLLVSGWNAGSDVEMTIMWEGKSEWQVKLGKGKFEVSLSPQKATGPLNRMNEKNYSSIKKTLNDYSVVCFHFDEVGESSVGISRIEIL